MKRWLSALRAAWGRLTARERIVLLVGGVFLTGLLGYSMILSPWMERFRVLDRLIVQKEADLKQLVELRREYTALQTRVARTEGRITESKGEFSLLSYLEGLATSTKVRPNIVSMRPQVFPVSEGYREVSVEVKIENVTLDQIVQLLASIENSSRPLKVKRLHMKKRFANPQYLDATVLVSTFEKV